VIEQDGDGHVLMMIKLNFETKKEKNKNQEDQGKCIMIGFYFALKTS
jgi:hypothetical protein